ncbi:MAG: metallophosphoesterase, partial [Planctomycetota bacterium]
DITDSTDREGNAAVVEAEWIKASYSMSLLDGAVSYGVCPGNHDKPGSVLDFYNQYFSYTRFGFGHYPGSNNDNNYDLFSAGGMDFIIVHLQVYPDQGVFEWANEVLDYYSDRIAILTMHQYLNTNGSRMAVGDTVWNQVIAPNNNVQFVFCGHNHGEAYRMDVEGGREVHQLLADYQSYSNGGNGYLRIMRFVPSEDAVYVKTYSPWLANTQL